MVDTFTSNVGFRNQSEGGNANTWGTHTDDNWELNDNLWGDVTEIIATGGTVALTDDQERVMGIVVSGTLVSNLTIEFSGRQLDWIVANDTTGAFSVTLKVTGQTGITVAQGTATLVWCDGTDIRLGVPTAEVVADTTPQLGGDLDANGFNIDFDNGTGIRDDSANEHILFAKVASAVNYVESRNAATGNAPRFAAAGGDTNIDLTLAGKGTGGVVASFRQATGLGLKDSDSSHDLQVKTSSNLTATRVLDFITGDASRNVTLSGNLTVSGNATLPAGTALVQANNLSDVANAATAFGNIKQAASDSATGVVEIATQSEMEAASDTGRAVTPGRMHFHPGHPKAGGNFDGTGTPAFRAGDYGMGAITDNGTGDYTLALDTAFANTNYWMAQFARSNADLGRAAALSADLSAAKTESSIVVTTARCDGSAASVDVSEAGVVFWGDYA